MISNKAEKSIFIIAGEESGDVHGAELVRQIKKLHPTIKFIGHGGDRMQAAGVNIIEHISKMSLVGLTEVIKHLPYIHRVMKDTISLIKKIRPARIVLIDYPGFNLSLAKKINNLNIPITYFILPQAWAWKEKRAQGVLEWYEGRRRPRPCVSLHCDAVRGVTPRGVGCQHVLRGVWRCSTQLVC